MKKQIIFCLLLLYFIFPASSQAFDIKTNQVFGVSGFYCPFWQGQGTVVQGTWIWAADANQTDYASVKGEVAGMYYNSSDANLDEYKWSNIFLTKGSYKITIVYSDDPWKGIAEVLFGTTSLNTKDMYNAGIHYNMVWTFNFTLLVDTTADLRFRVNGKTLPSIHYIVAFSHFVIEKTG